MTDVLLEVIATSVEDALEAEQGGAGRIELIRDLDRGGLTPSIAAVKAVASAVRIPVRVMLRESETHGVADTAAIQRLRAFAAAAQQGGAAGFVIGFLRGGAPDLEAVRDALGPSTLPATFHHAFDEALRADAALASLSCEPRIDRVLTAGGRGAWRQRRARLQAYRRSAPANLIVLAGGGLDEDSLRALAGDGCVEAHVGRAARLPPEPHGRVRADCVARLVAAAQGGS